MLTAQEFNELIGHVNSDSTNDYIGNVIDMLRDYIESKQYVVLSPEELIMILYKIIQDRHWGIDADKVIEMINLDRLEDDNDTV